MKEEKNVKSRPKCVSAMEELRSTFGFHFLVLEKINSLKCSQTDTQMQMRAHKSMISHINILRAFDLTELLWLIGRSCSVFYLEQTLICTFTCVCFELVCTCKRQCLRACLLLFLGPVNRVAAGATADYCADVTVCTYEVAAHGHERLDKHK